MHRTQGCKQKAFPTAAVPLAKHSTAQPEHQRLDGQKLLVPLVQLLLLEHLLKRLLLRGVQPMLLHAIIIMKSSSSIANAAAATVAAAAARTRCPGRAQHRLWREKAGWGLLPHLSCACIQVVA